jgi:CBS-domain-containing membrane protein
MKVSDVMTPEVRACTLHDSLNAAARIMWDHDCGTAPVIDAHGKLVGIVTDRDIAMAAYTQGLPLEAIPVQRAMSAKVISCGRNDELETAHSLMRSHEIHRIPVVDSRGRLAGIVSLSDLVTHATGNGAGPSDGVEVLATLSALRRRREPTAAAVPPTSNGGNGDAAPIEEPKKAPRKRAARSRKPSADLS